MGTGPDARARRRGALLGLAYGDALGCPIEGWRPVEIRRHFGVYDDLPHAYPPSTLTLPRRRRRRLRPLGLCSDDTQQALALLGIVLSPQGWSTREWARWLVAGRRAQAWRGTGRTFEAAVDRLARGRLPASSGSLSLGVGAAMRAGPLGAALVDAPETLAEVAMAASLTTHRDLRAAASAYAVAEACRQLAAGHPVRTVRSDLPRAVHEVEEDWRADPRGFALPADADGKSVISSALGALADPPPRTLDELGRRVIEVARPHLTEGYGRVHPNQGLALLAGLHGLGAGLLPDADPEDVLTRVVAQGDDTDSVGAVCGAVLGARFGDAWIPRHRLVDRERLEEWADAVAQGGPAPEDRETFCHLEAARTTWEHDHQRQMAAAPAASMWVRA